MQYIKGNIIVDGHGGDAVLESLGFKSEWRIEADKKKAIAMVKLFQSLYGTISLPVPKSIKTNQGLITPTTMDSPLPPKRKHSYSGSKRKQPRSY